MQLGSLEQAWNHHIRIESGSVRLLEEMLFAEKHYPIKEQ